MNDVQPRDSQNVGISLKKIKKPLIEKKRRDRINKCLAELKTILLKDIQHTGTHISRLDKADILELTVKYLQTVQRNQISAAVASDPDAAIKYESGFQECAMETMRFLKFQDGRNNLSKRFENHLKETVSDVLQAREDPTHVNEKYTPPTVVGSHFGQNHSMKFEPISLPISAFRKASLFPHQNVSRDVRNSLSIRQDKYESFRCSISAHENEVVPCSLAKVWRPW
ncbi:hypothetical protein ACJMK2_007113 [Sinanodonta woodiana]|uniref:BHLH domain-containing protein n=1 Tax=Sinanodonta woodiana TaxID=1069815 RepID=A0ABD3VHG7_SINWO